MTLIMVAPTGARKTRQDVPTIPLSHDHIVAESLACYAAGAQAMHLHVRNDDGSHSLDTQRYAALLDALRAQAPGLSLQITTEAVGQYTPAEQRAVVDALQPDGVSVALREMAQEPSQALLRDWYTRTAERGIEVQHIAYDARDLQTLARWIRNDTLPATPLSLLLVLGRYHPQQQSTPADLDAFLPHLAAIPTVSKKMVCAFGRAEIDCLLHAQKQGFDLRIGFENNHLRSDGSAAASNAERVGELQAAIDRNGNGNGNGELASLS